MSVELKNNQFLSYLIVLISLFVLVLFTKDQITNIFSNLSQKETLNSELTKVRQQQEELTKIEQEVNQEGSTVSRYTPDFTKIMKEDNTLDNSGIEDNLIDYFYTYASKTRGLGGSMLINSISISPEAENELGFFERKINISAQVSNEKMMRDFLDYLINEDSKYRFFIENFYHPNDGREGSFNIQVPLKIFYR